MTGRGQAHMLEGIVAGLLLLTSVIFALQMTAVTPLSASTSNQHIENQQRAMAQGVLATAVESGALKRAVLFWNASSNGFNNASDRGYYTTDAPENAFGERLEASFGDRGVAYNVYVVYESDSGLERQRMVYRGEPSDNAITASRAVTVTEKDRLYFLNGTKRPATVEASSFYAGDIDEDETIHNVLRVEVVAWRV